MPGFRHDPLNDVEAIRQLLSGYETGFPFLKEVVQNANDADASNVWIQWHEGLGDQAVHPLLQGPALIIANDGPFDAESKKGIELIGLSNRAADTERIGRFGLGVKSLFHVCEGFFFFESEGDTALRGFLTPWHGETKEETEHHQEWWDTTEDDWNRLQNTLAQILPQQIKRWFAIWIPLRSISHLNEVKPLRNDHPGDVSNCPTLSQAFLHHAPSIAESMIFLRKINDVTFDDGLNTYTIHHQRPDNETCEGTIGECRYFNTSFQEVDAPVVTEFQQKPNWPSVTDRRTTEQVPDKAKWEGGVAITISPAHNQNGKLRLFWSVFLPVGNRPALEVELPGISDNLHIFIHGYFFPNRDRTAVLGSEDGFEGAGDDNEESLKIAWNKKLATSTNGVIDRLLPLLRDTFEKKEFSENKISKVVEKLKSSDWFKTYRETICQTYSLVRNLDEGGWKWRLVDSATPRLEFPNFGAATENIVNQLVGNRNQDRVILIKGTTALASSDLSIDWTVEDLKWFCSLLKGDVLNENQNREYLTKLFKNLDELATNNHEIWNELQIYEVESLNGEITIVSANTLQSHAKQKTLFANGDKPLKDRLKDACPKAEAWFVVGNMPPGLYHAEFNLVTAAKLVLQQKMLGIPNPRSALIAMLLPNLADSSVKSAIRYLLHGSSENRNANNPLFLKVTPNDPTPTWNEVIQKVLEHKREPWRLVDATFVAGINDQQKKALNLKMCGADSFRSLCNEVRANANIAELPLDMFHDFLLIHLNNRNHFDPEADNRLLRQLKIHSYGHNLFTSVEESVWLAPGAIHELPNELADIYQTLCQNAKIVQRSPDRAVIHRQEELFINLILDPNGIIRLACQQNNPQDFSRLILHYLGAIGNPARDTAEALQATSWLPLNDGGTTTLNNLLWLEGAEDQLDRLRQHRTPDQPVITRSEIALDFNEAQGAWNTIRAHLIPKREAALDLLRKAFGQNSKLHFGIPNFPSNNELENWLKAVDGCEDDISPAVALIRVLWQNEQQAEAEGKRSWAGKVAAVFASAWEGNDALRYDTALEALRNRHEEADVDTRDVIIQVFHGYLAAAVQAGRWEDSYRQEADFMLLNQQGNWTPISQLVVPITGINRSAWANQHAVTALNLTAQGERDAPLPGAVIDEANNDAALGQLLQDYGNDLAEHLPPKLWGIFIALLGETPAVRGLADQLTGGRTETIRDELCGPCENGTNPRLRVTTCRYSCSITDGDTAEVVAINGDFFDAPLDMDQAAFLVAQADRQQGQWWVNRFFVNTGEDGVQYNFRLCEPAVLAQANAGQMYEKLEETIKCLLKEVLKVTNDRISRVRQLMDKYKGLGQMSLGRAQQEILATAQVHLSQLGIRPEIGSPLAEAIKKLDEATSLDAQAREERENEIGVPERNEKEARRLRDEGLGMLRNTFQTDNAVHHKLTEAMKTRIGREQYLPEWVPFELFQNADDALTQMGANHQAPPVFLLDVADGVIRCAHWGRPINQPNDAMGELKRSYERDLVKMLILHGSDKQTTEDDAAVTGKFGLGFKSVYLITDNPRVVSGDLAFDVVGAIYPRRLENDQEQILSNQLAHWMPNHQGGTVIELSTTRNTTDLSVRFADLASYLVIFARKIREIRILGDEPVTHRWQPTNIQVDNGWELWVGNAEGAGRLMHLKCREVSWLFGLDQNGVRKLTGLPCVWATAPLHSTEEVGFAINGPFDPDPGRTELGKGEAAERRNGALFQQASSGLHDFLTWCAENTDDCFQALGIEQGSPHSFWESWWKLFSTLPASTRDGSAIERIAQAVWPRDCNSGYSSVAMNFSIIPNGLSGDLKSLTSLGQKPFVVSGYLDSEPGQTLLADLTKWDEWAKQQDQIKVIVSQGVAKKCKNRTDDFAPEALTLQSLIAHLVGTERKVTADLANKLGECEIASIDEHEYDWPQNEREELQQYLSQLLFQNQLEAWVAPTALLNCDSNDLEAVRAALAPADRRLHKNYTDDALDFFNFCREEMIVTPEDLATWIKDAISEQNQDNKRVAASLKFLASTADNYSIEAARHLNDDQRNSLLEHAEFGILPREDQCRVQNAFEQANMSEARLQGREYRFPFHHEPRFAQGENELNQPISIEEIHACWNEEEAIEKFTVSGTYCNLVFTALSEDGDEVLGALLRDTESLEGKERWYRLLCLGACMSIPLGTNPADRIMRFWNDRLNDEFWGAVIPQTPEEAETNDFDQKLDAFFEKIIHQSFHNEDASGEDADFWRRVFYDFRKMHYYVYKNDLPAVFLQLANSDENDVNGPDLISFLRSGRIPPALQTPDVQSWTGVIGQSMSAPLLFVMRELRRLKVLPDKRFDHACFYMNSPARRVASQLSWITDQERRDYSLGNLVSLSEKVYDQVNRSSYSEELLPFFDLPLQWYAYQNPR